MKVSYFEKMCRERHLKPVERVDIGPRIVLIADGWRMEHPEFRAPHYQTVWAVGKGEEKLEVCRPLYFEGGIGSSNQADRIAAAMKDAREFAEGRNGRADG